MQYKNKKSSVALRTLLKNGGKIAKNGVRKTFTQEPLST